MKSDIKSSLVVWVTTGIMNVSVIPCLRMEYQ